MQQPKHLFEISWEVCNKVGGIYTVITSKLQNIQKNVDNYVAIGPYLESSKENIKPVKKFEEFDDAISEIESLGIKIHCGIWKFDKKTKVILIDQSGYSHKIDEIKAKMWEDYHIDSLNSDWNDYDNAILWSWCCGIVINKLTNSYHDDVYVHAHEWMSGGAIFYLKSFADSKYKTVFTTHATMLGRSIAGHGEDLYSIQDQIDPQEYANKLGVSVKHQTERALAHSANCFTTVSGITAKEAKYFYEKEVDVILFNGFDNSLVPDLTELNVEFLKSRMKTNEFLDKHFSKFYNVDLDKTYIYYTSGRNEYRNKGVDIYIKALGKLNKTLKEEGHDETIVNLFLIMVSDYERITYENKDHSKFAPLSTHNMGENHILQAFMDNGLYNGEDDKVKVILIPTLIKENDKFLNRSYYDLIQGLDLGVFPSFYEPWGYTPQESISFAVPTVTSDLSGFGYSIKTTCGEACPSVEVLKRRNVKGDEELINELFESLHKFAHKTQKEMQIQRGVAKWLALKYDWSTFINNYLLAYEFARKH